MFFALFTIPNVAEQRTGKASIHHQRGSGNCERDGKICKKNGATITLALGDNFYDTGVTSVDDSRFQSTFENVFDKDILNNFKVLAGNHDHNGNVQAQVDYSSKSARWNFPSLYYDFEVDGGQGKRVHFVFVDTVLLTGNSDVLDEEGTVIKERTGRELSEHFQADADEETRAKADDQWDWIESTLEHSTADFIVVAGHYPVYSICEHGPTSELVDKMIPLLEKYNVTAYLNGNVTMFPCISSEKSYTHARAHHRPRSLCTNCDCVWH